MMPCTRPHRRPGQGLMLLVALLWGCGDVAGPGGPAPDPHASDPGAMRQPNPFLDRVLWVDPGSSAARQVQAWQATRPADARRLQGMASQPVAVWFGGWHPDIRGAVAEKTAVIRAGGALPLYVAYNIPGRDCGGASAGGASDGASYAAWIRQFASGLADTRAVVILEPDALAGIACLPGPLREERLRLLADAVEVLRAQGSAVYLDAGHSAWVGAAEMAERLKAAGVQRATGFALNVSNFQDTQSSVRYGDALSELLGGLHYVIDTGRNGMGAASDQQWCNPPGRALGRVPTLDAGYERVDALLWVKPPGESDGPCNGGPAAGTWWAEYALGLATRAGS